MIIVLDLLKYTFCCKAAHTENKNATRLRSGLFGGQFPVRNSFEIISVFYFTCNLAETELKVFSCWKSSEIIPKFFQWHWTCWEICVCCVQPQK